MNTVNNGKGDKPRPVKNIKQYIENWDKIEWAKLPTSPSKKDKDLKELIQDIRSDTLEGHERTT